MLAGWLGAPREALVGRRLQSLLTAGALIFYEAHCARLLKAEGHLRQIALDLRRADGTPVPALLDWRRVDAPDGHPLGSRLVVFEASERRAWEEEVLAQP